MRRQRQNPSAGSPPQAIGLQRTGRVVIPMPANDNARSASARATLAVLAAGAVAAGLLLAKLLG